MFKAFKCQHDVLEPPIVIAMHNEVDNDRQQCSTLVKIHVALPRQALSAAMGSYGRERESKRRDPNSTNRVDLLRTQKSQRLLAPGIPWTAMINGKSR